MWHTNARRVVQTLYRLKGDELVPALVGCLESSDSEEMEGAVMALGLLGDSRALQPLIGCLSDADSFVVTGRR